MKKLNLIVAIVGLFTCSGLGQSYNTAIGMRIGTEWGLTVRQRVVDNYAAELILQSSLQRAETQLTILGISHKPLISRRFNFFYGLGFHKGWADQLDVNYKDPLGMDFIAGLELTIGRLNLSYDYKPAINFVGGASTFYSQTGISLRYVVGKRDKYFWEQKGKKKRNKGKGGLFGIFK